MPLSTLLSHFPAHSAGEQSNITPVKLNWYIHAILYSWTYKVMPDPVDVCMYFSLLNTQEVVNQNSVTLLSYWEHENEQQKMFISNKQVKSVRDWIYSPLFLLFEYLAKEENRWDQNSDSWISSISNFPQKMTHSELWNRSFYSFIGPLVYNVSLTLLWSITEKKIQAIWWLCHPNGFVCSATSLADAIK